MSLDLELRELYDIRSRKAKQEKLLHQEAMAVKSDVNNLIVMFAEGITDISLQMSENESLVWDSQTKRLIYYLEDKPQFVEAVKSEILIKIKPFLRELVKKAQKLYL